MPSEWSSRLRIIFMGSAEFGAPALEGLLRSQHQLVTIYTQPPRPAGRGYEARRTAIHEVALRHRVPVATPGNLRDEEAATAFMAHKADLAVVAAYGLILPPSFLRAPRLGCINLHASLLPRWRGAAPIQRAILAGDDKSGVTIIQMDEGLDTGAMLARQAVALTPETTAQSLHDDLAALAARILLPLIDDLAAGRLRPVPQPADGVTYAEKIKRDEGELRFDLPAPVVERRLRALNPHPGCWTQILGSRINVLAGEVVEGAGDPGEVLDDQLTVACSRGAIRLTHLQRAGRRPMPVDEFLHGFAVPAGTRLG